MSATVKQRKPGRPAKDHRGRLRKIECPACGFIARASAAALRAAGVPVCGCGEPMQVPQLRDLERIDPDGFERSSAGYRTASTPRRCASSATRMRSCARRRHGEACSPSARHRAARSSARSASATAESTRSWRRCRSSVGSDRLGSGSLRRALSMLGIQHTLVCCTIGLQIGPARRSTAGATAEEVELPCRS